MATLSDNDSPDGFFALAFSYSLVLTIACTITYISSKIYSSFFGQLSRFPGPLSRSLSIIPYLQDTWAGDEVQHTVELHEAYGPVVRIAPKRLSFVGSAQAWKDIHGFSKGGDKYSLSKDYHFYGTAPKGKTSLLIADNHDHARMRKILSPAFSERALKEQEPLLSRWAGLLRDKLVQNTAGGKPIDMVKMLNCATFDIMSDLSFAEPLYMLEKSEYVPWVKNVFSSIQQAAYMRCFWLFNAFTRALFYKILLKFPAIIKKRMQHEQFTNERVDRRLAADPGRPDLWTHILAKADGPDGLTRNEHYMNAGLFMLAGTETTASALIGTVYYLCRYPDVMKRLTAELRTAFPNGPRRYAPRLPHEIEIHGCGPQRDAAVSSASPDRLSSRDAPWWLCD